jgi:putative transposase
MLSYWYSGTRTRCCAATSVGCVTSRPSGYGTLRRELLDRVLILGEQHLQAVLTGYQAHYNTARPHQGIAQHVPDDERDGIRGAVTDIDIQQVRRKPILNGLINEYTRAA